MALHRTSRLSVRASPDELKRWNHIAHQHGHATTAHCGDAVHCGMVLEELETLIRQCDKRLSCSGRSSARRRCERSAVILH